jgi:hypothetical protein
MRIQLLLAITIRDLRILFARSYIYRTNPL